MLGAKYYRQKAAFTEKSAAARLGINLYQLHHYESQGTGIPPEKFKKMCDLYQCTASEMMDYKPDKYECSRVKQYRLEKGWTIEQLAFESDVSDSCINYLEHGKGGKIASAMLVARALGVTLNDLFGEDYDEQIRRYNGC